MTCARITSLLLLSCFLAGCASSRPAKKIDGIWNANLQNPDGSVAYTFMATLAQTTGSNVDVSSFLFTATAPCFTDPIGQTAMFDATGHSGGFETGPFGMSIATAHGTMVENTLTLDGSRGSDGNISGSWTLTGLAGCSGGGTYTLTALKPL